MTEKDLKDFCIKNAGKIASGKYGRNLKIRRGRIIGYTVDINLALILLEDANSKPHPKLPKSPPTIPFHIDGDVWSRVVSPANFGFAIDADTVVIEEISEQKSSVSYIPDEPSTEPVRTKNNRSICHDECDPTWCHRKYTGLV